MKKIPLTQGMFAMVDDEDFEFLNQWKWSVHKGKNNSFYAKRNSNSTDGLLKRKNILMHREIMKITDPNIIIDHEDHNGLNCQKSNMRSCNHSENNKNRSSHGASKFLGVSWQASIKRWRAEIKNNNVKEYIGVYINEVDAAKAYDKKAIKLHGEFANLNFKNT
jgi:hypothetical protein